MKYYVTFGSPIGPLTLIADETAVTHLLFQFEEPKPAEGTILHLERGSKVASSELIQGETALTRRAREQLAEYFDGRRREFDLPLAPKGTPFQLEDWRGLQTIPYGETRSYGQLAAMIGRPKAVRAVGMANHCNPISIFIPCHRVIGADGSLTGYGGGLDAKKYLLALEQKFCAK